MIKYIRITLEAIALFLSFVCWASAVYCNFIDTASAFVWGVFKILWFVWAIYVCIVIAEHLLEEKKDGARNN